jgi:WD40 repeat protein
LQQAVHNACRLDWSQDGSLIATGHTNGTLRIWDGKSYELRAELIGHDGYIASVQISANGQRLVSSSVDGNIMAWNLVTSRRIAVFDLGKTAKEHGALSWDDHPHSAAINPDGTQIAATSSGTCKVWDIETQEEVFDLSERITQGRYVAWSNDGNRIAVTTDGDDFPYRAVLIIDAASGAELTRITGVLRDIRALKWAHDDRNIAMIGNDRELRVWNFESEQVVETLRGHSGDCLDVAWSRDSTQLASASADGTVCIWNFNMVQSNESQSTNIAGGLASVQWTPDSQQIIAGDISGLLRCVNVQSGSTAWSLKGHAGLVSAVAIDPNGQRVATGGVDGKLRLWSVSSGAQSAELGDFGAKVCGLAWSPGGELLASASGDRTLRIYNARTGDCDSEWNAPTDEQGGAVAWSPDGETLAWLTTTRLRVWQRTNGELKQISTFSYTSSRCIAFSPDGRFMARPSSHSIIIHDADTFEIVTQLDGHMAGTTSVTWSPIEARIASSSFDGTVKLWDTDTWQEVFTLSEGADVVWSIAWSPDGRSLIADADATRRRFWDAAEGYRLVGDRNFVMGRTQYWQQKAIAVAKKGKFGEAHELLSAVLKWRPDDASVVAARAAVHAQARQWDKAVDIAIQACERDPRASMRVFEVVFEGENAVGVEAAKRFLTALIDRKLSDETFYLYYHRGHFSGRMGQWEEAAHDWVRASEIEPDIHWGWVRQAVAWLKLGNITEYQNCCRQLIRLARADNDTNVTNMAIWTLRLRFSAVQDIEGARELAAQSIENIRANPEQPNWAPQVIRSLNILLGNPTPDLEKPLESTGTIPGAYSQLNEATRCIRLGEFAQAQSYYDQACRVLSDLRVGEQTNFWLLSAVEIQAVEVKRLLSEAKAQE